jgi:hypothetical protein
MEYYPDAVDVIMKMLRDKFGGEYKAYYEGDPNQIPASLLPAIVVQKLTTEYAQGATRTDEVTSAIAIKVLLNKQDDYNALPDVDLTERKLKRRIEGRDYTTGQYLPQSIAGMFRVNLTLGDSVIDSTLDVEYFNQSRDNGIRTSEGAIVLIVRETVQVPDRM